MNALETLLLVVVVQQFMVAAGWAVAGRRLGLSRTSSAAWGRSAFLFGLAALWPLLPPFVPAWVLLSLMGACIFGALLLLWGGLSAFFKRPLSGWAGPGMMASVAVPMVLAWALGWPWAWAQMAMAGVMTALVMVASWQVRVPVKQEFGGVSMSLMLAPFFLGGLVLAALWAGLSPAAVSHAGLHTADGQSKQVLLLGLMVLSLWFAMMQGYMVLMRLVHRLRYLSLHDPLTGLFNRRAFEEKLAQEMRMLRRLGLPFSVMVVDVDHFKRINDSWGHAAGDQALVRLAQVLKDCIRESDDVGRLGGEEFCVLARGAEVDGAMEVAERIRQGVQRLPVASKSSQHMSVSIGVACMDGSKGQKLNGGQLIDRADRALYAAKQSGRNRVVLFDPSAHPGELPPQASSSAGADPAVGL
jgi:diguanylate cyclase (GGDEF)-like protein